ncbi:MAG: hypothetical protein OXF27_07550 [Acidobacteria bacterium]|nr:hypothetical protein [Acidobacteriota bacterium]
MTMRGDYADPHEAGNGKTIFEPGRNSDPAKRLLRRWPLPPVELDVPGTQADFVTGASWPADRMLPAIDRLNLYEALYRGDLSYFVDDATAVRVLPNYFGLAADGMAALIAAVEMEPDVQRATPNAVVDATRYGRTYLVAIDGVLMAFDPRFCTLDENGETLWVVTPYVSSESRTGYYDRAMIYVIDDGAAAAYEVELRSTHQKGRLNIYTFGETGPVMSAGAGGWGYADRPISLGGWGKSGYDDMIPIVTEMAKRLTTNSWIMDQHQFPTTLLPMALADAARTMLRDFDFDAGTWSPRDTQLAVEQAIMTNPTLWAGDGVDVRGAKILEWDGALTASFQQLEMLKGELRLLPGVQVALAQESGDAPSGRALREMAGRDREFGSMLHNEVLRAITEALGRPVDLPSPFAPADTDVTLPPDDSGDGP